nr:hypothetical protein [Tanacetum cinerariifolium]
MTLLEEKRSHCQEDRTAINVKKKLPVKGGSYTKVTRPQTHILLRAILGVLQTHTQNFMHASVDWNLYDSCGVHHVTSKDKEIFMLVEKDYPLRKVLALVMICYKLQVENFLQMANDLVLKIYKIANSPRQQGD